MNKPALEVHNLSYKYGSINALRNVSFSVDAGKIMTITGPNGAGKTTMLLCISGLLNPSSGKILINGYDPYQSECSAKKELAFLPDIPRFYQELTVWEHIQFIAEAHSIMKDYESQANELLIDFGLIDARDMYPHALSRGMRLKLGIILSLIRPFSVLLMDEPTSSLDSQGTEALYNKIFEHSSGGAAIVITTHNLSTAQLLGGQTMRMEDGTIALSK